MTARIITAAEATALREAMFDTCDDCEGAGHYICPECGDSADEPCDDLDHDEARHVPCDLCRGKGRIQTRGFVVDTDLCDDLAHTVEAQATEIEDLRAKTGKLLMDADALRDQLTAARAALIDSARKCEHRCGDVATIRAGDEMQEGGAFRYCDKPACRGGEPVRGDLPHAAALRAARGAR